MRMSLKTSFIVGSLHTCDIVTTQPTVSKQHCELLTSSSQTRLDARQKETANQLASEVPASEPNRGDAPIAGKAKSVINEEPIIPPTPYWAILVQSKSEKSLRLVGTAVAIGPYRLLTLASIVDAISEVKDTFPILQLRQAGNVPSSIRPTSIIVHPKYPNAVKTWKSFEADLSAKLKLNDSVVARSRAYDTRIKGTA